MSLEMDHNVIVPQKKIMSGSFLNSGTLIVYYPLISSLKAENSWRDNSARSATKFSHNSKEEHFSVRPMYTVELFGIQKFTTGIFLVVTKNRIKIWAFRATEICA